MTVELAPDNVAALAAELLACPVERHAEWVVAHRDRLNLRLIEALKQYSDQRLLTDPLAAEKVTSCALLVAHYCRGEPLALALACWARGNWQAYHDPQAAIRSYLQAVASYRAAGDLLDVARLLSNLVFAYCDCGRFAEAQAAYQEARSLLLPLGESAALYLLRLEQNYGWLLHNQAQYERALAAHERALELARQLGQPVVAAEVQVNRALTLGMVGRLVEGEAALLQERAVAEQHGQALTVARIDMNLGELYTAQGRPAEALRRFQAAREQFVALDNQMEVGTALLCEAALFERIGALREARRGYARAQQHFTMLGMLPYVGEALTRGAAVSRRYGDFARAGRLLDEAEALWARLDQPLWRALALFERVALALVREDAAVALGLLRAPLPIAGNPLLAARRDMLLAEARALRWGMTGRAAQRDGARRAFQRALGYARREGDRWMERQALAGLGRLALPDDPHAAREQLEAAVAHDDATRQALTIEELKASFQTQTSDLLPLLARLSVEQAQPLAALSYAWRAKGSALLDLLRAAETGRTLHPGLVELDRLRQELAAQRWQAALQAADMPESLREREHPAIRALEQRLYDLRRQLDHQSADAGDALLADPARLLGRMEADLLIEYLACGDSILALRADQDGACRAVVIGEAAAILDLLDELYLGFQNVLAQPADGRAQYGDLWLDECRPLLQRCYELLLAPLGRLPDETRLLIAPCDPLYLFPFGACWDGTRYLIERCEIHMTPCGALQAAPPRAAPATAAPLIIAASAEGRLHEVAAEAAAVHAALPESVCLVDDPRTLHELSHLAAAPRLLHIAAHSVLREDAPIFSALQLPGGLLSVEQCYDLSLAGTELVALSGCATGAGLDSGGSLLAFQSALFVAGARQVLSSLWPVDDQATAAWMGLFYRSFAAGMPPAAALRRTQRALIASAAYGHPALWAAFTCSRR